MLEGVDYSYSRPNLACLVQSGKHFVLRYLSHDENKALSAAEVSQIRAAGLGLGVVFEDAAGRATQGFAAGRDDAAFAAQQLLDCGVPPIPIYFAVDEDVDPASVQPYFDGAAGVLGLSLTGAYGSYRVCAGLHVGKRWQTYAWSGGQVLATADLYQYANGASLCGGSVDLTRSLSADPGIWGVAPPTPVVTGTPRTTPMTVSEKRAWVRVAYLAALNREPENVAAQDAWASRIADDGSNVDSIVAAIADSAEGQRDLARQQAEDQGTAP